MTKVDIIQSVLRFFCYARSLEWLSTNLWLEIMHSGQDLDLGVNVPSRLVRLSALLAPFEGRNSTSCRNFAQKIEEIVRYIDNQVTRGERKKKSWAVAVPVETNSATGLNRAKTWKHRLQNNCLLFSNVLLIFSTSFINYLLNNFNSVNKMRKKPPKAFHSLNWRRKWKRLKAKGVLGARTYFAILY